MPDTSHCCCDGEGCQYVLAVQVRRCPPAYNVPQVEPYTFTFDGPGGEHVVVNDMLDTPDGASGGVANPAPGTWTVTVAGTAGTCVLTFDVVECESQTALLHAWHNLSLGCLGPLEGVDWSVSGVGVGTPSSGTTGADGRHAFLLCGDGDFDVALSPPDGSHYAAAGYTIRKAGLTCPKVIDGEGIGEPEEGYLCGCVPCPWPVKDSLLLTTKYGTFGFSYAQAASSGAVISITPTEPEARTAEECPPGSNNGYGGRYVLEAGGGAATPITYVVSCRTGGGFGVAKQVQVLPSAANDGSGGLVFAGFRMASPGGASLAPPPLGTASGGVALTDPYECHTVTGSGAMPALVLGERRIWTGVCFSSSSPSFPPSTYAIPGTDETVSIAEAP